MEANTISNALLIGNKKLKKITNNYINETFWILSKCLNYDKSTLLLNQEKIIDEHIFNHFLQLLKRRQSNEPLQLILESVPFYNYLKYLSKLMF